MATPLASVNHPTVGAKPTSPLPPPTQRNSGKVGGQHSNRRTNRSSSPANRSSAPSQTTCSPTEPAHSTSTGVGWVLVVNWHRRRAPTPELRPCRLPALAAPARRIRRRWDAGLRTSSTTAPTKFSATSPHKLPAQTQRNELASAITEPTAKLMPTHNEAQTPVAPPGSSPPPPTPTLTAPHSCMWRNLHGLNATPALTTSTNK